MNPSQLHTWLKDGPKPDDLELLRECVDRYPYSGPLRMMLAKASEQASDFDRREELLRAGAHVPSRRALFAYLMGPTLVEDARAIHDEVVAAESVSEEELVQMVWHAKETAASSHEDDNDAEDPSENAEASQSEDPASREAMVAAIASVIEQDVASWNEEEPGEPVAPNDAAPVDSSSSSGVPKVEVENVPAPQSLFGQWLQQRAEATGDLGIHEDNALAVEAGAQERMMVFFFPILALVFFTVFPSVDLLRGVIAAILITFVHYGLWRVMPLFDLFDTCVEGIKSMVPVLAMLLTLFVFVEANDRLGLTPYVIEAVSPFMTADLLPVLVFVTVSLLSFTTGSNWGVIAITMPIAFPLAQTFDVSIPLVMGALFSASGFGSHACFYSDSTVLSAQGAGCKTHEHALTQLPYALLGAVITATLFTVVA